MILQEYSWFMNIIRGMFIFFDSLVYWVVKWILYITFDLANLTTSSSLLNTIYQRVYVILTVYMAFKLSFSFFQYIVNPQSMKDQKKGVGKLFVNVFIMLAALIMIPTLVFGVGSDNGGLLSRGQKAFLPMVPRIILGIDSGNSGANATEESLDDAADDLTLAAMQAFFMPSNQGDNNAADKCKMSEKEKEKNFPEMTSMQDMREHVNDTCKASLFGKKYYIYSYMFGVSTIIGVYLCVVLLGLCIDIAKRVFKLVILQVIAPIPIMSLMDPKEGKNNKFQNWLQKLISTYLELFIKLGVIYLVLMLIQQIVSKGLFDNYPEFGENFIRAALLTVALIIGLFKFASEAPKFISEAIGIQGDGGMGDMGRFGRAGLAAGAGFVAGAMHGDALAGAEAGRQASLNAKAGQPARAFHAGAEKAAQITSGDDKRQVGFGAAVMRHSGARHGYSTRGYRELHGRTSRDERLATAAEENAQALQATANDHDQNVAMLAADADFNQKAADRAQALYDSFQASGGSDFNAWRNSQSQSVQDTLSAAGVTDGASLSGYARSTATTARNSRNTLSSARADQRAAHTAAATAQRDATTARQTADQSKRNEERYQKGMGRYGVSTQYEGGLGGFTARGRDRERQNIHTLERGAANALESIPVAGAAVRTLDSAHQQGILNDIDRGQRGAGLDEVDRRRGIRDTLDAEGTAQSAAARMLDSQFGDGHDGHIGNG
jgi:hypothetical protein